MKSMTGFGQAKLKNGLSVNVRSVNGRFLEIRVHAPREYYPFEQEIKSLVKGVFKRGTVDVSISRSKITNNKSSDIILNTAAADKWLKVYGQLAKKMKSNEVVSLESIASRAGVITSVENNQVSSSEKKEILSLVTKAFKLCDSEKTREGKALQQVLKKFLVELLAEISIITKHRGAANSELKTKMLKRWEKLGLKGEVDPQRLAQEMVIHLDKTDIEEEVVRLKEHIKMMKALLVKVDVTGKKLDFYTQELLREVNTIGSKSHHSELTSSVINAKAIIERFREQVQNIE